jgi:hypothetical protein
MDEVLVQVINELDHAVVHAAGDGDEIEHRRVRATHEQAPRHADSRTRTWPPQDHREVLTLTPLSRQLSIWQKLIARRPVA